MDDYWQVVEPVWDAIDIYSGPEVFRTTFESVPKPAALLFSAHFCQSEICNGGFHQFFYNSTGVLAPEAAEGFRAIGQTQIASILESAMQLLGSPYPRNRDKRQIQLASVPKQALNTLDGRFYKLINKEAGGFIFAATEYATNIASSP